MDRAKTILKETLFSKNCDGQNDLVSLPGGRPLIAKSLIYRLTFDPEDDDDDDDYHRHLNDDNEKQLFTNNNHLKSSIDISDNDENVINTWSSNWDNNNQHDDDDHNVDNSSGHDDDDEKHNQPECSSTIFMDQSPIKLNVSSLADEIIDSEMNSLKCLQIKSPRPPPPTTTTTTIESKITINDDAGHQQGLVIADDDDDDANDEINVKTIDAHNNYHIKSTGQCPSSERKRWKSLILPYFMKGAINTETSITAYNYPPTRAFLSCCVIS